MNDGKKAHIFAHNHRPAEDPMGEVLLIQERGDKIEITARSKPREHLHVHNQKTVLTPGATSHILLDRDQMIELFIQLREWIEIK